MHLCPRPDPGVSTAPPRWRRSLTRSTPGFSLIELLCVMAIISILVGMMAAPLAKALRKARGLTQVVGPGAGGGGYAAPFDDIRSAYSKFRLENPNHEILRRTDFIKRCKLSPRAEEWIKMSSVVYHPFAASAPASQVVLEVIASGIHGDTPRLITVADLLAQ